MSRSTKPLRLAEVRDGSYRIESGDREEISSYWVNPNRLRCNCPAGQRRRHCRHLEFVLSGLEAGARPDA